MANMILITRANEHAQATQRDVAAMGYATLVDPMLEIVQLPVGAPISAAIAGLIVTSRNAMQGVSAIAHNHEIPMFIVGKETAELFKKAGFTTIRGVAEQSAELPRLIKAVVPHGGALLHVTSQHAHTDFYDALLDMGYGIDQRLVYDARAASALQDETLAVLRDKKLSGVLFYSARTAEIFSNLVAVESLSQLTAYCLSDAVAAGLNKAQWNAIKVAQSPNHAALMDCLK